MYIQVIYPDVWAVSEQRARGWAADAIANNEVDSDWIDLDVDKAPIEDIIDLLNDAGNITCYIPDQFSIYSPGPGDII